MVKAGTGLKVTERDASLVVTKTNGSDWNTGTAVLAGGVKLGSDGLRTWEWKVDKGARTIFGRLHGASRQ